MGLESALWEATRPAFRVCYIHDPTSTPRVPTDEVARQSLKTLTKKVHRYGQHGAIELYSCNGIRWWPLHP